MRQVLAVVAVLLLIGCGRGSEKGAVTDKESLLETDRAFAAASAARGAADAFNEYLHDDALMLPAGNNPVKGRTAIYDVMKDAPEGYVLAWTPEDGEVARSGDFGYTWGKYVSSLPDSSGAAHRQARPIFIYSAILVIVNAAVFHWLEGWDWLDSIYFVIITFTTIGYGDLTPTTPLTKLITIFVAVNGVAVLLMLFDEIRRVRVAHLAPLEGQEEVTHGNSDA